MKDRKAKPALKVVHHNDRAQIKRVLIWPPENGHHEVCYF